MKLDKIMAAMHELGEFNGDVSFEILALAEVEIEKRCLTFIDDIKYPKSGMTKNKLLLTTREIASSLDDASFCVCNNPRVLFFKIHNYISTNPEYRRQEFETNIGKNCTISPLASISKNNVNIGNNVCIEEFAVIRENTEIKDNSIIRSGVKIGGEGFEFKRNSDSVESVIHLGGVIIGENVEIQYNSCIDKAIYPWDNTEIGDYSKVDNLVYIAHGVKIGKNVLIVANSGIGGRVHVGDNSWIGFSATISNAIKIGKNSRTNIGLVVTKNVQDNSSVTGNFAIEHEYFINNQKKLAGKPTNVNFCELQTLVQQEDILKNNPSKKEWIINFEKIIFQRISDKSTYSIMKRFLLRFAIMRKYHSHKNYNLYIEKIMWGGLDIANSVINDVKRNLAQWEDAYNLLSDEKSRLTFINVTIGKILCDLSYLDSLVDVNITYNQKVLEKEDELVNIVEAEEIFVDCGAYTGDTLKELFDDNVPPKKYFGFEPDDNNYQKLQFNLEKISNIPLNIWKTGVFDENTTINFIKTKSGHASKISENGIDFIEVVRLDDIINEPITFIKMDVEGSEYPALEGAARLIKEYKPKLAISMYHRFDDFRRLPLLIKRLNPDYSKFFLRHMSLEHFGDTVLFIY
jgi:UDP-3-O-[3-hydroxymyristoyl] glucosamine N-acyltransferase